MHEAILKALKLLRLSKSSNEHEAALAAARAQEIITRHGLTAQMLALSETEAGRPEADEPLADFSGQPDGQLANVGQRISSWVWRLAHHLAKLNGCFVWWTWRKRTDAPSCKTIELMGRPSDVETVRYLFGWLRGEVERLTAERGKGLGAIWRRNFAIGCVEGIVSKLQAACREAEASLRVEHAGQTAALMRLDQAAVMIQARSQQAEAIAFKAHHLRNNWSGSGGRLDMGARNAGREAGRNVNVSGDSARLGSGARMLRGRS